MKKKWGLFIVIGFALLMSFSLIGCGEAVSDSSSAKSSSEPSGSIQWYEAKDHIGDRLTVCGPVAGTFWASGSNGKPTFLNVGNDHPNSNRFVVVIWVQNRGNFPESPEQYYAGRNICVTGLIQEYNGVPQIEATSPSQIDIQ